MIKLLKKRIFMLVMLPIALFFTIGIGVFVYSSYTNTIDMTIRTYQRYTNINGVPPTQGQLGVYRYYCVNDVVSTSPFSVGNDDHIDIATKANNRLLKRGFINNYIYSINDNKMGKEIVLIENKSLVNKLKGYLIGTLIAFILFIIALWKIAKKISQLIVKPVEETLDKQKIFISDASHELKTPLAVIGANIDVLENKVGSNKWITYIQQETQSMNKLVNDLLVLSKMEDVECVKEQLNLSSIIELNASVFEPLAYEKQLSYHLEIEGDIEYYCNEEDIKKIVGVLIDNAIKHSDREVLVTLKTINKDIYLEVSNTGMEIPIEDQSKIFDRFYRIDKSRNRNEKRYGLGLSIANMAAKRNNASITVTSYNHKTSFVVIFHKTNIKNK